MDNIPIIQEVIHSLIKALGTRSLVMLKVDMEKAFDCIQWSFVSWTLQQLGLYEIFIR